jgi:hypothetical protein
LELQPQPGVSAYREKGRNTYVVIASRYLSEAISGFLDLRSEIRFSNSDKGIKEIKTRLNTSRVTAFVTVIKCQTFNGPSPRTLNPEPWTAVPVYPAGTTHLYCLFPAAGKADLWQQF